MRWLSWALIWGFLLAPVSALAVSLSNEDAFTAEVARSLSAELPEAKIAIKGPLVLSISLPNDTGKPASLGLVRMWEYCSRNKADCEATLRGFLNLTIQFARQEKAPLVKEKILPVVRSGSYVNTLRNQWSERELTPIAQQLAGDLWIVCVLDTESAARVLHGQDSEKLGLSNLEVIDLAKRNLAGFLPAIDRTITAWPDSAFGVTGGDAYYGASRVLLHEQWTDLAARMRGTLLVTIPDSGIVYFADSASARGVQAFQNAAIKSAKESQRPISPAILAWSKDGWREWKK